MTHASPKDPPRSLDRYYRCLKCGGGVAMIGYGWIIEKGYAPPRPVLWAGGVCFDCGHRTQFGFGGERGDYKHARFWCWGKEWESQPGPVRRASPEFWDFVCEQRNSRLVETLAQAVRHAVH